MHSGKADGAVFMNLIQMNDISYFCGDYSVKRCLEHTADRGKRRVSHAD